MMKDSRQSSYDMICMSSQYCTEFLLPIVTVPHSQLLHACYRSSITTALLYDHIINDIKTNLSIVIVVEHIKRDEFLCPTARPVRSSDVVQLLYESHVCILLGVQVVTLAVAEVCHIYLWSNNEIKTVFGKVYGKRKTAAVRLSSVALTGFRRTNVAVGFVSFVCELNLEQGCLKAVTSVSENTIFTANYIIRKNCL